jgi:uracil DNA glycosylase
VNAVEHTIIKSVHPSGLSASKVGCHSFPPRRCGMSHRGRLRVVWHQGFFGSKPFSQTNAALEERGQKPIDWQV